MSKGSTQRPTDKEIFDDNYDRIFGKEKPESDPYSKELEWSDAPLHTQWGSGMKVATLALDKDSCVDIYAHEDDLHKVASVLKEVF